MSARDELLLGRSAIEANRNRVLRCLSNEGLMNIDEVREDILSATTTTPTLAPPHKGEGNRPSLPLDLIAAA